MSETTPIDARIENGVGRITLRRPEALNALTTRMVDLIDGALGAWSDLDLRAVVIDSSAKHFCAGGDVRRVREAALAEDWGAVDEFFRHEYRMNRRIAEYRTPIVSLIDGVCFGGGMGIAIHGHFRVVTERASMAMPETAIGFIPDVGGTYFLSRLPGAFGQFLGLTGTRIGAGDALALGLATHVVPADRIGELPARIAETREPLTTTIGRLAVHPEPELGHLQAAIGAAFGAEDVEAIRSSLAAVDATWARESEAALDRASPKSLIWTHELIARGRERSLAECLDAEFAAAARLIREGDFIEGVRARLVDKDERPAWLRA